MIASILIALIAIASSGVGTKNTGDHHPSLNLHLFHSSGTLP
ncbi:secreted protein [Rhodopirellula baltica WH47]|uniref:Secreted protein n=1 Tax=Rhodopirellula baltica WH47 TaxID=991778 RepID=F2B1X2_RHOBT|nr:secreted protein [Rhodopirellula baltica WH47]